MGFMRKADFELYRDADKHYNQVLTTRDFLALGVGTIISTSIFTLPGQVAAQFAGPGVVFSYCLLHWSLVLLPWLMLKCQQ